MIFLLLKGVKMENKIKKEKEVIVVDIKMHPLKSAFFFI